MARIDGQMREEDIAPEPPYNSGHPEHASAEVLASLTVRNAARQAAREKAVVDAAERLGLLS